MYLRVPQMPRCPDLVILVLIDKQTTGGQNPLTPAHGVIMVHVNKLYLLSVLMKVSVQWDALQMECLKRACTGYNIHISDNNIMIIMTIVCLVL